MKSASALLVALTLLTPATTFAQFTLGTADILSLETSPQYPRPNEIVTVTPRSSQLNLLRSTMTVSVGGKSIYSGPVKGVPVTLGGPGQTTTVSVTVTDNGESHRESVTFRPGDLSLVAEPVSSVPALYSGKGLVPQEGTVRFAAIADFRTGPTVRIDPKLLTYTWKLDNTTLLSSSGIGKDSIILTAPLTYRTSKVTVEAQSRDGKIVGGDSMKITPQGASVRLYVHDPLQGILFDHALSGSHAINESEATFTAVPYSLALTGGAPAVQWFLSGSKVEAGPHITLRPEGTGEGSASLSATASAGTQIVTAALSILFGAQSTNIFGL